VFTNWHAVSISEMCIQYVIARQLEAIYFKLQIEGAYIKFINHA